MKKALTLFMIPLILITVTTCSVSASPWPVVVPSDNSLIFSSNSGQIIGSYVKTKEIAFDKDQLYRIIAIRNFIKQHHDKPEWLNKKIPIDKSTRQYFPKHGSQKYTYRDALSALIFMKRTYGSPNILSKKSINSNTKMSINKFSEYLYEITTSEMFKQYIADFNGTFPFQKNSTVTNLILDREAGGFELFSSNVSTTYIYYFQVLGQPVIGVFQGDNLTKSAAVTGVYRAQRQIADAMTLIDVGPSIREIHTKITSESSKDIPVHIQQNKPFYIYSCNFDSDVNLPHLNHVVVNNRTQQGISKNHIIGIGFLATKKNNEHYLGYGAPVKLISEINVGMRH